MLNSTKFLRGCVFASLAMVTVTTMAQDKAAAEKNPMGYFMGFSIGQQIAGDGFKKGDFDASALAAGLNDALEGTEPALSQEQLQAVTKSINEMLTKRRDEAAAMAIEKEAVWMQQTAKKEGLKELESGIHYKVIKSGKGDSPKPTDRVSVHYTGTLTNGEVFDSSVERGTPAEFPVNGVIQGWQIALQKMKPGDKWKIYLPSGLAYGDRGSPPKIGPNEILIFEVELLEIK